MKRFELKLLTLALLAVFGLYSCTNLEIEETDSFITEGFQGLADPQSALDQLYNQVGGQLGDQANTYALTTVTTDEQLIPTRGADWGDNGRWRKLHQHEWGFEETDILTPFDQWNANQLLASQILDERSAAPTQVGAAASFLRAYSMFLILDLYGQVPYRDTQLPSSTVPEVLTGTAAVDFIAADLDDAISGLPAEAAGTGNQNRATKAAARFLKAKLLLNKHIYLGQLGEAGTSPAPQPADMQEVVNLVDAIAADGYALEAGYFDIFTDAPDNETIWFIDSGNTGNRIFNGLHYNSTGLGGGGWNGFSTLAEFYDLFEGDANQNRYESDLNSAQIDGQEERRGGVPQIGVRFTDRPGTSDNGGFEDGSNVGNGFLVGQQYALDGTALQDRQGNPLEFSREFVDGAGQNSLINNSERTGIRVMKYNPRNGGGFANHVMVMRYSDAHLMKAEAILRGASGGDATALVNELRTLRGATPLGSVDESALLDERGRELYCEGWRRNDMIRFGAYTRGWEFKSAAETGNDARKLFPIPLPQLLANPNLVQNPGY
ncbi:RagB/SusD family nutrient uptake outer membrane protein [Robiginitalea aurantiaca]|uniref:RagB/SusD family nutrient uptake outer membrane protein n=1 Tax=Robiginitalea aurantiaca TaxID=3056915 RepID=A0ABT7WET0_9FLAO|nr:RagB/SusD family nutrient uptake outer membrane protein [Robiginitalea aurantiaca]MDM9631415.1 RagB/SusD family nutrient uptake outer membrane protein [Robiginitalea aurantiaca]